MKWQRDLICCLSGLQILSPNDLSAEHYCPRSRVPALFANHPYNIRPALKIINQIKGPLLPCEWERVKFDLCYHALISWNLNAPNENLIIQTLNNFGKEKGFYNPCRDCILSKVKKQCEKSCKKGGYWINKLFGYKSR